MESNGFKLLTNELADGSDASTLIQLAKQKLDECRKWKAEIATEELDQEIDAIDQLASQTLDEEQHKQSKRNSAAKIRSAEEKAQSREKKKHRRRK